MRALPVLSTASLAAVLACNPGGNGSPGKADGEACTSAAECRSGLCFRTPGAGAAACASSEPPGSADCLPPGQQIISVGVPNPIDVPQPTSCQLPVRPPATTAGDIPFIDLGEVKVGDTLTFTLPSGTTSFSIVSQAVVAPPPAAPRTPPPSAIVFQGVSIPNSVVPTNVVHVPTGTQYFSDTEPLPRVGAYADATSVLAYYGGLSPISGAFTVPNTAKALDLALTGGELPSGAWSFVVNDFAFECLTVAGCSGGSNTSAYHVQVLVEQRPFTSTGTLDVEVYLATTVTSELASADAATRDPQFQRWVRSYASYLAKGGVCLRKVTVHDLPSWVTQTPTGYAPGGIVDVSGNVQGRPADPGCDDLSQLFTLGLAQNRAVHLFMADALEDRSFGGFTVLGVDGSIPGPSGVPGTINGGAVVGLFGLLGGERTAGACSGPGPDVTICGTDALALVSAHETGHWLGLYHTTELDGTVFDPLTDTAACPCVQCAPFALRSRCAERSPGGNPTFMLGSYCTGQRRRCGGARNLMFWLFDDRFAIGETSRQQGDVMRRNPAVR